MGRYLDKFSNVIGKRQTEQILKLLNKKRNTGQIRSVQEFTQQLETLMRDLTSTNLIPSLSLFMAEEDEKTDSETFNNMIDRVQDDLEAAFEESINIDEVQKSHEGLVRDVILKNLRAGVAELESQITLFEFINQDVRGFDAAIFSTFRESREGRTQRGGDQTQVLFADPRRNNILFPATQDATVELVGERLTLAESNKVFHNIVRARQIFDSESPQSELVVEPAGSKLSNIIDNTKGTYWIQAILFAKSKPYIKIKLEFDLGGSKEVNVIEIEPASRQGLVLEAVHYLDGNNIITNLNLPERIIEGPASVRFKKVATSKIILTFRNENAVSTQFEYGNVDPVYSQALEEPPEGFEAQRSAVNEELKELLGSSKVKALLGIKDITKNVFSGYEFLTGLDNIRVGITNYQSRSIYVSSPLNLCGAGQLGLKTLESRPYIDNNDGSVKYTNTTYDIAEDSSLIDDDSLAVGEISNTFFQSSIEYWAVKQDLNAAGALIKTTIFPILPLGVERVEHERLVLTDKSDSSLTEPDLGKLQFFTTRADGNIKVYRNGELLNDETGNALANTGWQLDPNPNTSGSTPNNGIRMTTRIKLLDLLPGDIVTVSYNPLLSTTTSIPRTLSTFTTIGGLQVVDRSGDLSVRAAPGQIVILDKIGEDSTLQESNIYLVIIIRQNTAEPTLSAAVEEYTLLSGCKDPSKFEEV